jgi:hypothetical protein
MDEMELAFHLSHETSGYVLLMMGEGIAQNL